MTTTIVELDLKEMRRRRAATLFPIAVLCLIAWAWVWSLYVHPMDRETLALLAAATGGLVCLLAAFALAELRRRRGRAAGAFALSTACGALITLSVLPPALLVLERRAEDRLVDERIRAHSVLMEAMRPTIEGLEGAAQERARARMTEAGCRILNMTAAAQARLPWDAPLLPDQCSSGRLAAPSISPAAAPQEATPIARPAPPRAPLP